MEPIDWSKPIELMDGTRKLSLPEAAQQGYWILDNTRGGYAFLVDIHGRLGGVRVVRNRKERRKLKVQGWVNLYKSENVPSSFIMIGLYDSFESAQKAGMETVFACIYIDREVEEGEGS